MAKNSVGTIKCNRQDAAAYIAYMMAGSYFKDARMANGILEQRMKLEYLLLPAKAQNGIAERIDRQVSRMDAGFLKKISKFRSAVHVRTAYTEEQEKIICLWFETGLDELVLLVDKEGGIFLERHYDLTCGKWANLKVVHTEPEKASDPAKGAKVLRGGRRKAESPDEAA